MLQQLAEDLWVVEHDHFWMGIHFPGRMTVVRLSDGSLWVCSPVPINDDTAASMAALGPVRYVVAPNRFHHSYLASALERYPEAGLYGAPGLSKKRKDLTFTTDLGPEAPDAWRGDIEQVQLQAVPALSEVVFFHRKSGTLITTDLFMNVHSVKGFLGWLVYWTEGCYKRAAVPRIFHLINKDKDQMRNDLARIAAWPTQHLLMAHGDIVSTDAAAVVRQGFSAFGALPEKLPAEV